MKGWQMGLLVTSLLFLAACGADSRATLEVSESPDALPNVATQYCLEQGYHVTITTDASGTTAFCLFPDGSRCDLWAFYHQECPGPDSPPQGSR
ncbi:MAG: DUF333 domain-containing protein [Anaerolineae bacterium]|nr:DUF333 domain-containing protein [Anaerolineae bacterium]